MKIILEAEELRRYELPINKIIHGDAIEVLRCFPSNSIDCVITSPPYWGKRTYPSEAERIWGGKKHCKHTWRKIGNHASQCKKCGAVKCQLGLEPTPQMYVDHLIEVFREVKRVLKPTGNVFVVIDDTYSGGGHGGVRKDRKLKDAKYGVGRDFCPVVDWSNVPVPRKSLCLVPELFAIRMVYELGFILRSKIIWAKKVNIYKERMTIGVAMPESVKDRLSHAWEYIYHFTKEPKYYFDLNAVRVPPKLESIQRLKRAEKLMKKTGLLITSKNKYYKLLVEGKADSVDTAGIVTGRFLTKHDIAVGRTGNVSYHDPLHVREYHPLGANPGDVLQVNLEPFPEAHFAIYPTKLVEFLIKIGCPEQVCKKCGKPRERIVKKEEFIKTGGKHKKDTPGISEEQKKNGTGYHLVYTVGWTDCGCNAGFEPGIVLDPFLGSGTTALVALKMGRRFIGIEIVMDYCEMAERRIREWLNQRRISEYL